MRMSAHCFWLGIVGGIIAIAYIATGETITIKFIGYIATVAGMFSLSFIEWMNNGKMQ